VKRALETEEQAPWIKGLKRVATNLIILISGDEQKGRLSVPRRVRREALQKRAALLQDADPVLYPASSGGPIIRNWQESPLGSKPPPLVRFGYCVYLPV
jgi:hypothetical protein